MGKGVVCVNYKKGCCHCENHWHEAQAVGCAKDKADGAYYFGKNHEQQRYCTPYAEWVGEFHRQALEGGPFCYAVAQERESYHYACSKEKG